MFARGQQADAASNIQHFGGTRYNNLGANSMSVASASVANHGPALFPSGDKLNEGQLIDNSDSQEPGRQVTDHSNQHEISVDPRIRSGAFIRPSDIVRPNTRRGRGNMVES